MQSHSERDAKDTSPLCRVSQPGSRTGRMWLQVLRPCICLRRGATTHCRTEDDPFDGRTQSSSEVFHGEQTPTLPPSFIAFPSIRPAALSPGLHGSLTVTLACFARQVVVGCVLQGLAGP